ncbi:hypothetical protein BC937DRAFT_92668 [Endogone sp. FLAS-F59071]|nr:hypothetical protein BC937DRAFT_92668 [Endogone sp. FLAS-F59071]|eukprot:RUS15278.1 hypothetical protein BC937DRAFT_92668 [Endogone sp. FLAS-F59071]
MHYSPSDHLPVYNHGNSRFLDLPNEPTVYVGNVSLDATCKDYFSYFGRCGLIDWVDVKHGFGFVHYSHPNSARDAINGLHNTYWLGRNIRVEKRVHRLDEPPLITVHPDKSFKIFLDNLFKDIFVYFPDEPAITSVESQAFRAAFTSPDADIADNGSIGSWNDCYKQGEVIMQYLVQERLDSMQCTTCIKAKEKLESKQCTACTEEVERMLDAGHVARFARRLGLEYWMYGTKPIQDQEVFYVFAGIVSVLLETRGISTVRIWLEPWLEENMKVELS